MRRLFSAWLLCILAFGFIISGAYTVSAQTEIYKRLPQKCSDELATKVDFLKNKGSFDNIFNLSKNLPFVPAPCALDDPSADPKNTAQATTAIPVKYFPFVIIRVYRFLISLAFYLFGLGLLVLGVTIQVGVFNGNYDFERKIRSYLSRAIVGIATVLFAYYIVAIILWIFNVDSVLNEAILTSYILK
jgi:hypothetical protein